MTTAVAPKRLTFGNDVIEWIEEYCVLPTGENIGEPFRLLEWQKEWIRELYRTDGEKLQYRWALLGVPKGNGKSPLAAAIALYHLLGDPDIQDPWVVVAAASDKQADIVFDACKRICEMSPELAKQTDRFRWEIQLKDRPGKLERVAASGGKLDGKIVSMLILDELHEWTLDNWIVLTGGAMKRRGSQIIQITTAGWDQESVCYREYVKGETLASMANPTYFVQWYSAPENMDYKNPETWKAANPSWGTLVFEDILEDLAINMPESQFRRYRLNQWVESEEYWLPAGTWEACAGDVLLDAETPTFVGWDASTTNDSTAVAVVQKHDGKLHTKVRIWARAVMPDGSPDYSWLLPIKEVEDHIRELCRDYQVHSVAFDPAFITWSASDLEAEGLPMVKMPQTPSRMGPATAGVYQAVIQGNLVHDGGKELTAHVKAAKIHHSRRGEDMLEKQRTGKKIDGVVSLTMAVGEALIAEVAEGPSTVFFVG